MLEKTKTKQQIKKMKCVVPADVTETFQTWCNNSSSTMNRCYITTSKPKNRRSFSFSGAVCVRPERCNTKKIKPNIKKKQEERKQNARWINTHTHTKNNNPTSHFGETFTVFCSSLLSAVDAVIGCSAVMSQPGLFVFCYEIFDLVWGSSKTLTEHVTPFKTDYWIS